MPIYEYRCKKCQKVSEFLIGVSQSKVEIKCKYCGSNELDKIISSAFISKGTKPEQSYCPQNVSCNKPTCMNSGMCHQ